MTLNGKNALIFAATGGIASGVARTFAQEGAHVWLSSRNAQRLEQLASEIQAEGGQANFEVVDATNQTAVTEYVARTAASAGRIDAVFNGIGQRPEELAYPTKTLDLDLEGFFKPFDVILGSTFLTAKEAARYMTRQGSGSIIVLSASLTHFTSSHMANLTAVCGALEALSRTLASEFSPSNVRVNCLRASAMPETETIALTSAGMARVLGVKPDEAGPAPSNTPSRRPLSVAQTAAVAAFLASDASSGITGQLINVFGAQTVG
jgi:3-oxoacyl-[acyl-carrier protein] reductase